ncbi:MAG: hypothetical protein WAK17_26375 [Candidatus Nitrosopolaris sp.]
MTNIKKNFTRRIKQESNQIPKLANGVIAMELNSLFSMNRFVTYARQLLGKDTFDNILAMIFWHEKNYQIIHKISVNDKLLEVLAMPFTV